MAKAAGYKMADNEETLVQYQIKTGNRDVTGADFRWIQERNIQSSRYPADIMVVERREWGNFYGQLVAVKESGNIIATRRQALPVAAGKN